MRSTFIRPPTVLRSNHDYMSSHGTDNWFSMFLYYTSWSSHHLSASLLNKYENFTIEKNLIGHYTSWLYSRTILCCTDSERTEKVCIRLWFLWDPNIMSRGWHWVVHNCTIFLCSLDVRNIVQGGDPLYAGFFFYTGLWGLCLTKMSAFFCKKQLSRVCPREKK